MKNTVRRRLHFLTILFLGMSLEAKNKSLQCESLFEEFSQSAKPILNIRDFNQNRPKISSTDLEYHETYVSDRFYINGIKKNTHKARLVLVKKFKKSEYNIGSIEYLMAGASFNTEVGFIGSSDLIILNSFLPSQNRELNITSFKSIIENMSQKQGKLRSISFLVDGEAFQDRFSTLSENEVVSAIKTSIEKSPEVAALTKLGYHKMKVVKSQISINEGQSYLVVFVL